MWLAKSTTNMRALAFTLIVVTSCSAPSGEADEAERGALDVPSGGYFVVEARHSGKVLDVASGSSADGANVQQWSHNGTDAQTWRFDSTGDGYYFIRSKGSNKALDVAAWGMNEGDNVQQWSYSGGANQQWKLEDAGGGYYRIRARHSGKYLDVAWGSSADGANVAQVNWYASDAQQWKLLPQGGGGGSAGSSFAAGDYTIQPSHSGKCIDVPSSSTADGAKLQQWTCNGTNAQRFHVAPLGGGLYEITNVGSGKAFDVTDRSMAAYAPIQQWGYGGGDNQKFALQAVGDGTYAIQAHSSGMMLDISGASTADGAALIQYPSNNSWNQHFRFVPSSGPSTPSTPTGPTTPTGWKMVWNDEFDYSGLPADDKWSYDVGGSGWGNGEAQFYTDKRTENARVEGGRLIIEARKESYGGMNYTSARLVSRNAGNWLYGRFEIRAKIPGGRGTWPAIWMLPTDWKYGGWPDSGEIDIMEHVGFDPGVIHATTHTKAYNWVTGTQKTATTVVGDAMNAFHTYAAEWSADRIDIFVDDNKYFTFSNEHSGSAAWPFDQRFHLILNIAVGGSWGGVKGIDDGAFPQRMEVDYVRAYQR